MAVNQLPAQQKVLFINPVYSENDVVLMPQAEGRWSFVGDLMIQRAGDDFYHLRSGSQRKSFLYEGVFFKLNNALLLDYLGVRDSLQDGSFEQTFLPTHQVAMVNISGDQFRFSQLNYLWFYSLCKQKQVELNYFFNESGIVVTSPTKDICAFLSKYQDTREAFSKPDTFVLTEPRAKVVITTQSTAATFKDKPFTTQKYTPSFPMKNGWLGADNDASVPLDNNRTLWLFGDTYVGNRNQQTRDSITEMISSSAAITTGLPGGTFSIDYYWKEMYTAHPKALFESNTNRYRYWIKDAFVYNRKLYVLLRKILPFADAPPDEVFNFTLGGSAFAIVSNFETVTPDQWKDQLIPFPFLYDSTFDAEQLVKEGEYVYFLLNRKGNTHNITQLVRLPCAFIESAEGHFEYFARDGSWKTGMNAADMRTILDAPPGNTTRYHPEERLWVMTAGPGLLDRRILVYTAPALTGPWSAGRVVYECPEQTPGSPSYNKNNFCYLGREHNQYYDKKTRSLLLTYDCNTSDGEQLKHSDIYIPRVIKVKLAK